MATVANINFTPSSNLLYNKGVGYVIGTYEVQWNGAAPSFYHVYVYACEQNETHTLYETDGGDTTPTGQIVTKVNVTSANAGQTGFMFKVFDNSGEVEYDTIQVCRSVTFHEPETPTPTSDLFSTANMIYKITKNIDLNGAEAEIGANCMLDFQGGSISNGTLVGNLTKVCGNVKITATHSGLVDVFNRPYGEYAGGLRVVTFDDLDDLKIDIINAPLDTSINGVYLVKSSTGQPCAKLTVLCDSMYHCMTQIIEGSCVPNSSGVMDGTHDDANYYTHVRVYKLSSAANNLTNIAVNTWGKWCQLNTVNVNQSN